jgi:hypothetical protein
MGRISRGSGFLQVQYNPRARSCICHLISSNTPSVYLILSSRLISITHLAKFFTSRSLQSGLQPKWPIRTIRHFGYKQHCIHNSNHTLRLIALNLASSTQTSIFTAPLGRKLDPVLRLHPVLDQNRTPKLASLTWSVQATPAVSTPYKQAIHSNF